MKFSCNDTYLVRFFARLETLGNFQRAGNPCSLLKVLHVFYLSSFFDDAVFNNT